MCYTGNQAEADRALAEVDAMNKAVLADGWDCNGLSVLMMHRATKSVPKNAEGQIYIEPQGFCVLAGIGVETGEAKKALDSVKENWIQSTVLYCYSRLTPNTM